MQFWYVPANYHGRGYAGGGMRGYGRIIGGAVAFDPNSIPTQTDIDSAPVQVPVNYEQIIANILSSPQISQAIASQMQQKLATAEATGQPVPVTQKEAGLWSGIKNFASKAWDVTKKVASNPIVSTIAPYALGALVPGAMPLLQKGMDTVGKFVGDKLHAHYNPSTWQKIKGFFTGNGYAGGRRGRLRKGSPEAKAYMAMLRARKRRKGMGYAGGKRSKLRKGSAEAKAFMAMLRARRRRRGRGYTGGMVKGWTAAEMADKIKGEPDNEKTKKYYFIWRDMETKQPVEYDFGNGKFRKVYTKMTKERVDAMLAAQKNLANWYLSQAGNSAEAAKKLRSRMIKTRNKKIPMRELMMKDFNKKKLKDVVGYWKKIEGDNIKAFGQPWFRIDGNTWDDDYKKAMNKARLRDRLDALRKWSKKMLYARTPRRLIKQAYADLGIEPRTRKKKNGAAVAQVAAAAGAPPAAAAAAGQAAAAGAPPAVVAQVAAANGAPPPAAQAAAAVAAAPPPAAVASPPPPAVAAIAAAGDEFDDLLDESDSARILANNAADQAYLDGLDAELNDLVRKARNTTTPRVLGSYRKKIKEVMRKIRVRVSKMN